MISCFNALSKLMSIDFTFANASFFCKMTEFLRGESFSLSTVDFYRLPGIDTNLFFKGEWLLNSTIILDFVLFSLLWRTLKAVKDFDFLDNIGDSIFFRTKFDTSSLTSLLNCFSSALSRGFFKTFKSNTFRLRILYRYSYDRISKWFIIEAKCSFWGIKISFKSSC